MKTYVEKLRANSEANFAKNFRAMNVLSGKHLEGKVQGALRSINAHKLADKIAGCNRRSVCSSIYCRKCRNTAAAKLEARLRDRFVKSLNSDPDLLQDRWRYLTVLCAISEFNVKSVKASVDGAREVLRALKRKYQNLWMQGAFEFELVDFDDLSVTEDADVSVKLQTLLMMMDQDESKFVGKKILVHYHAVVDIGDYDGREIGKWLQKRYSKHSRQVQIKQTISGQAVDDKIRKIASYGFKNRLRYNKSFITSGYETGEYFANGDAGKLIKLYHQFIDAGSGSYKSILIGL